MWNRGDVPLRPLLNMVSRLRRLTKLPALPRLELVLRLRSAFSRSRRAAESKRTGLRRLVLLPELAPWGRHGLGSLLAA